MTIDQVFNSSIGYYDDWMKKALLNYDDIFKAAQDVIPFDPEAQIEVLDLGAGTGLFSKHVMERCPKANFLLYDLAEKMLGVARDRFCQYPKQFRFVIGDYRKLDVSQNVDLTISSFSIHHLADDEKRDLFRRIYGVLKARGLFINIDQIRGETPYLQDLYWKHWLKEVRRAGASEERIRESVDRRAAYDRDASLLDQLQWLKEAGFVNVDCIYKNYFAGVFLALKE
jgi:tRNA (cmo5U34)-methyltransferase